VDRRETDWKCNCERDERGKESSNSFSSPLIKIRVFNWSKLFKIPFYFSFVFIYFYSFYFYFGFVAFLAL
jgi:hypothetical protein